MKSMVQEELRKYEGRIARITSTEGEVIIAKVVWVSDEHQDVILDVLSTNQPERYERFGKKYNECAWVLPFEFIRDVQIHTE
jgi:hypothetical protein